MVCDHIVHCLCRNRRVRTRGCGAADALRPTEGATTPAPMSDARLKNRVTGHDGAHSLIEILVSSSRIYTGPAQIRSRFRERARGPCVGRVSSGYKLGVARVKGGTVQLEDAGWHASPICRRPVGIGRLRASRAVISRAWQVMCITSCDQSGMAGYVHHEL
ncbi:hypothetical protein EVAR_11073_1 [Eumeta japonica]|uniref:Uncharacterized protein n=1 Tax=Eumeta variegata TaxID=151549 RepID=A0A4C1U3Z1_EUMVA|nr:hypothetical protein EVAR_11073_1 [Eumeta japonica]